MLKYHKIASWTAALKHKFALGNNSKSRANKENKHSSVLGNGIDKKYCGK